MPREGAKYTQIHLSDKAYEGLQKLAQEWNYAKTHTISRVIADLAANSVKFEDARPKEIREADLSIENDRRAKVWNDLSFRRPRLMGQLPTNYLLNIAKQFDIVPYASQRAAILGHRQNPFWRQSVSRQSNNSIIGPVLEAIGIGWLRPLSIPLRAESYDHALRNYKRSLRLIGA